MAYELSITPTFVFRLGDLVLDALIGETLIDTTDLVYSDIIAEAPVGAAQTINVPSGFVVLWNLDTANTVSVFDENSNAILTIEPGELALLPMTGRVQAVWGHGYEWEWSASPAAADVRLMSIDYLGLEEFVMANELEVNPRVKFTKGEIAKDTGDYTKHADVAGTTYAANSFVFAAADIVIQEIDNVDGTYLFIRHLGSADVVTISHDDEAGTTTQFGQLLPGECAFFMLGLGGVGHIEISTDQLGTACEYIAIGP